MVASPTLADLPKIGAEAVRIAFRMGVLVDEISQSIEAREAGSPSDSWAAVVMNVNEATMQKELDSFNTSTVGTSPRQNLANVLLTCVQELPNTE